MIKYSSSTEFFLFCFFKQQLFCYMSRFLFTTHYLEVAFLPGRRTLQWTPGGPLTVPHPWSCVNWIFPPAIPMDRILTTCFLLTNISKHQYIPIEHNTMCRSKSPSGGGGKNPQGTYTSVWEDVGLICICKWMLSSVSDKRQASVIN